MIKRTTGVIALTVALTVSACSTGSRASSHPTHAASQGRSCPTTAAPGKWPTGVPATVPRPAGLHVVSHQRSAGLTITRFTTTESLVQAAGTFRTELRKAGFELRGGDAEGDEVDQRFGGHGYRGALKLHGSASCSTEGTLVGTRLRQSQ